MADWQTERRTRQERMKAGSVFAQRKDRRGEKTPLALLEAVIRAGDRVCLEGDNQKQADFLGSASQACLTRTVLLEFIGPSERVESPHLHIFDLPRAFDDGVIIGRGALGALLSCGGPGRKTRVRPERSHDNVAVSPLPCIPHC